MREELAVADGLEGREMRKVDEGLGLGDETVDDHLVDTGVDAVVEFGTRS